MKREKSTSRPNVKHEKGVWNTSGFQISSFLGSYENPPQLDAKSERNTSVEIMAKRNKL